MKLECLKKPTQTLSKCIILATCLSPHATALNQVPDFTNHPGPGEEVVIVYNTQLRDSIRVAEHYAFARKIPTNHLIGLNLPTAEEISRTTYKTALEQPLLHVLESRKLWKITPTQPQPQNPNHPKWQVSESKIRYMVLCYGVPLKISPDPTISEPGVENLRAELRRNEAAVDSELALLPFAKSGYSLTAFVPNKFFTTTNSSVLHPTNGILMVARLDGPTPQIAMQLVDLALEAERNGLWGNAYFDMRGITSGGYAKGDEWINTASKIAMLYGFETYTDTNAATFPNTYPMSHIAFYVGWYDETVSGPFLLDNVEFMPGAFAYHLHSNNGGSLRKTHLWIPGLLAKGATISMGSVYEPYLDGTPDIGVFFARFIILGFTFGEAAYASIPCLSWQTTVVGDPLFRPFRRDLQELQKYFQETQNPMLEWVHLRHVNMILNQKLPYQTAISYLNELELTKRSPILMEKLAWLYIQTGKPNSAILTLQKALALNPSPQQRIRISLQLAELLINQHKESEAAQVYLDLIRKNPPPIILKHIWSISADLIRKHVPDQVPSINSILLKAGVTNLAK